MMNNKLFRSTVAYAHDHIDEPFSIDQLAAALNTSHFLIDDAAHLAGHDGNEHKYRLPSVE